MGSSNGFYDHLAPFFRAYAERRRAYLDSIDRLVISRLTGTSLLDVGAGDGVRAARLAEQAGLERLELVEPSSSMASLCRRVCPVVHTVPIQEFQPSDRVFDNVTCLWNVMGHIPGFQGRVDALVKMSSLLSPDGSLHLDVHNRYNIRAYGLRNVLRNMLKDLVHPGRENGEREFDLVLQDRRLRGRGYLFSPSEIRATIRAAGLRVVRHAVIDYETGVPRKSSFQGQLYFELSAEKS